MTSVARLFCGSTCRVTLDDVQFALGWVKLLTIGELPWQDGAIEGALPTDGLASLSGRLSSASGVHALTDHRLGGVGVLLEELGDPLIQQDLDRALHLARDQLVLAQ